MKIINKILIANRGEIAARIIRTCRVMGIKTVLVVSEADVDTLATRLADETIIIGGPGVTTYLNIPVIIKTAKDTGADAIHPGYGFLSEKPELPQACADAGLIFIGPKADHMIKLGNKLTARAIAEECGVPCLPGSQKIGTYDEIHKVVDEIGFPIMLKAASGGGGRGMKIVTEAEKNNLKEIFDLATAESKSAFADGTLYIEKYLPHARHIEVQVIGDKYGNIVHLGERDCSVQRRHQKMIEESGAPNISNKLRNDLHTSAVKLANYINYENAGTVEFVVDQDTEKFYFLEVNTRIQVEHPVTEMITGIDLVQEQINVANGEKLSFVQDDIKFTGHAIECRINAEVAEDNFRPTPGKITRWDTPQGPGIRLDSHCFNEFVISIYYDSLIGKLIVQGKDRQHALKRMLAALDEFTVQGIGTTISFLQKILKNQNFELGKVNTRLLEEIRV
ncbi:PycA1: pyruvate carboxylase, subunit A [Desulfosarcina variabilis str. Montpellier]|uniref:acetyl-CoA carboxylase biotin carboxylase subunit n=1 Tax=Desulfosarcina variabilis TaxID=2300 RepID=UPI003AFB0763